MRLCHDDLAKDDSSLADWFSQQEMLELVYIHKSLTSPSPRARTSRPPTSGRWSAIATGRFGRFLRATGRSATTSSAGRSIRDADSRCSGRTVRSGRVDRSWRCSPAARGDDRWCSTPAAAVARGATAPMCAGLPATIAGPPVTTRSRVQYATMSSTRGGQRPCSRRRGGRCDLRRRGKRPAGRRCGRRPPRRRSRRRLLARAGRASTSSSGVSATTRSRVALGRDQCRTRTPPAAVNVDLGRGKATGWGSDAIDRRRDVARLAFRRLSRRRR